MKKSSLILAGCALVASSGLWAHGYISQPEARGFLCKQGGNSSCGAVQWEPQSLEGPSGFPAQGPADGTLAGAGLAQFGELNEQTSSRWTKRAMQAGPNTFSWQFTANHATRNWRYYITKADWNPNQVLSRASFELTPFCVVDGQMKQPPMQVSHSCNVPARSGYQVILGVWEIGDTVNSFYNVVDVLFKDGATPPATWAQIGTLYPSVDLKAGDSVVSRVFDASGERTDLQTRVKIGSASEGQRNTWAYQLASRINAEQPLLQAGQMDQSGKITPVYGQNALYAKRGSNLTRIEVQINKDTPPASADFMLSYLKPAHIIQNGQLSIDFSLTAVGELEVSAFVYDHGGAAKGFASAPVNNSAVPFTLVLNQPKAGHHQLVVKAVVKGSGEVLQKTFDLMFSDASVGGGQDYVFPDGLRSYQAGTRVLQPKTGKVYVCKPFPNSGFCLQWSASATHYEPGVGSHWQNAWTEQ